MSASDRTPALFTLEARLGYSFRRRDLLIQALTHASFANESDGATPDNEGLEFLGDSVLSFLVADLLFRASPASAEGTMSRHKALLVSDANLAVVAERLGLGEHLRLGVGEEKSGGRAKGSLLSGALEAILAAVYLDGGTRAARALVRRALLAQARQTTAVAPRADHKTLLQEMLQGRGVEAPRYRVIAQSGPEHRKRFRVRAIVAGEILGEGEGGTKKEAEQGAAREALARLGRDGARAEPATSADGE
jgi:ribonuclease-3